MLMKVLFAAVLVVALLTGWNGWVLHEAYITMREAPQGQSFGSPDAKIVIVEFMDYRCNPCRSLNGVVQEVVAKHPDIRVVIRHLPIYKKPSVYEARIAMAAGKQGKFAAMHEILITRNDPVQPDELQRLCTDAGVDYDRLQKDMHAQDVTDTLLKTLQVSKVLRVHADPSFLIGHTVFGTEHRMPTVADFDALIAASEKGLALATPPAPAAPAAAAVPAKG
jgi:protein-disulfide isomerase